MASFVFVFFATPFILVFLPTSTPGRLHLSLPEPRPIHPPEEPVSLNTDRSAARATYLFSSFYHVHTIWLSSQFPSHATTNGFFVEGSSAGAPRKCNRGPVWFSSQLTCIASGEPGCGHACLVVFLDGMSTCLVSRTTCTIWSLAWLIAYFIPTQFTLYYNTSYLIYYRTPLI